MVTSAARSLAVAVVVASAAALGEMTALAPVPASPTADVGNRPPVAPIRTEARYRIGGKVRLLLFWASRDDVGSARLSWSESAGRQSVSLLAGSNPERAPSGLNQWIYLREESRADGAAVFAIRSVTEAESAPEPTAAALDGPLYTASCAAVHQSIVDTSVTTVSAGPGLTYRAIEPLLDRLAAGSDWVGERMARPVGADVGFLTALGTLMRQTPAQSSTASARPTRRYVYNKVLYDLTLMHTEPLTEVEVGSAVVPVLWRSQFAVLNRTTGKTTRFAVTYVPSPDGVTRPVQIIYQPNWWLKVELRLDDAADTPPDPGHDAATLRRIHEICAVAAE